jgi:hypothetical protein
LADKRIFLILVGVRQKPLYFEIRLVLPFLSEIRKYLLAAQKQLSEVSIRFWLQIKFVAMRNAF